ncbi:uncharacterized protein SAZU_0938 [Streptomyces azureus]|uniref:Uncharacterized protein n=1 Tax=Streptomyces azureus TaxID=146537 RepID=A0A0K8PE77_STRAJ|nr:uncharacterized protein SAZU_0938 [Streptomyces azureus]
MGDFEAAAAIGIDVRTPQAMAERARRLPAWAGCDGLPSPPSPGSTALAAYEPAGKQTPLTTLTPPPLIPPRQRPEYIGNELR